MTALRWLGPVAVLAGCGRIGFEHIDDAASDTDTGNVLVNAGCEGTADPWIGYNATVTLGTPARSGATACLVCRVAGPASTLDPLTGDNDIAAPGQGTTWRARGWVRSPAGATNIRARTTIREWVGGMIGPELAGDVVPLSDQDWSLVEMPSYTVSASNPEYLDFFIDILGVVGDCMLVDDLFFGPA